MNLALGSELRNLHLKLVDAVQFCRFENCPSFMLRSIFERWMWGRMSELLTLCRQRGSTEVHLAVAVAIFTFCCEGSREG